MGPSQRVFPSAKEVSHCEQSLARITGARSLVTAVATIVQIDESSESQVRDSRDYPDRFTSPKLGRMKSAGVVPLGYGD
jgi:hypothetical protein